MRGFQKHHRPRPAFRKERIGGQISIVAATLMATTFFLFFAFVVNTGMLVHAKINLQNAADVAAYAGAATQARQLDKIGILNYEMRRQYKRFLFRYYLMGNLYRPDEGAAGLKRFGARGGVGGPNSGQFIDIGVPAVCLIFKANDNFCQIYDLQPIKTKDKPFFLDAIGNALSEVLENLEDIRAQNCQAISEVNIYALVLWLFNTEPQGSQALINSLYSDGESQLALKTLPGITRGLGIVPRNLITHRRIRTLEEIINQPGQQTVTAAKAQALENQRVPMVHERTVLAYKSAQRTLGNALYTDEDFSMDELLPTQPNGLLQLETVYPGFVTYATTIAKSGGGDDCKQKLFGIPIQGSTLPVAVTRKEGAPPTYYAVRLKARPKLLFNPFGELTLEAYAAARPFGARLGPLNRNLEELKKEFRRDANPNGLVEVVGPRTGGVPNIKFKPDDGLGLYNAQLFGGLKNFIRATASGDVGARLTQAEGALALPNPAEYGRYIIPTDKADLPNTDPPQARDYQDYFTSGGVYSMYAPMSIKSSGDDGGLSTIQSVIAGIPESEGALQSLKVYLKKKLGIYFTQLAQGQGEGGEGLTIARVRDPDQDVLGNDVSNVLVGAVPRLTDAQRAPWYSGQGAAPLRQAGNVGYSVKLVSFRSLLDAIPSGDPEIDAVGSQIDH